MTLASPSVSDVRVIISTAKSDDAITAYIADAVLMAEGCSAIALMSESRQKAIVKYLTAHLICTSPGGAAGFLTSKSLGDASESYASGQLGMKMDSTPYGQQALAFDTSGCLANMGRVRAQLVAI